MSAILSTFSQILPTALYAAGAKATGNVYRALDASQAPSAEFRQAAYKREATLITLNTVVSVLSSMLLEPVVKRLQVRQAFKQLLPLVALVPAMVLVERFARSAFPVNYELLQAQKPPSRLYQSMRKAVHAINPFALRRPVSTANPAFAAYNPSFTAAYSQPFGAYYPQFQTTRPAATMAPKFVGTYA